MSGTARDAGPGSGHTRLVQTTGVVPRPGRISQAGAVPALAGAERGDIGPAHAPFGAVAPGPVGARVDEDAQARGSLAHPEPLDAELGDAHGQAHRRPGGVLVRDRAAVGEVDVPGLAVVG